MKVVDHRKGPRESEIKDVDVVIDAVGGDVLDKSLSLVEKMAG